MPNNYPNEIELEKDPNIVLLIYQLYLNSTDIAATIPLFILNTKFPYRIKN